MSRLKRPLTKNLHLSISGKRSMLNDDNNSILYNNFPVGLIIISKMDLISSRSNHKESIESEESDIKIKYINDQASEIFDLKENDNIEKIHEKFKQFKKFDSLSVTEKTLDYVLFNPNIENQYYGFFKNQISLIYVKYKTNNEELYIYADYYTDERKIVQNQLFQSLKFQYIATLFHELYNPINALLIMIETNQKKQQNKEDITTSNLGNNKCCSELNESQQSSELSESDCDKSQIQENNNIKNNKKMDKLYMKKLHALNEREKDIGLLVNMIYIFLQNLILYLRINLGVKFRVNEKNQKQKEENDNEKSNITNENINKEKNDNCDNNNENIYSDNYLSIIKKDKKLNLEVSFCKHLDKFSYLFNFKNIHYCTDFSYLSDKYILTDESVFFDFLGQIYSFLYYIVPKSKGFELSYSIINDNKLKIIFLKDFQRKRGYRSKKSRRSFSCIIGEDKFEATSTVKTSEMTQEILYKLSEILGIKLKIMEYENQTEDIYLTIILPFIKENELENENEKVSENSKNSEKNKNKISAEDNGDDEDNHKINFDDIPKIGYTIKVNNPNQLTALSSSKNKNINYLNPSFYQFAPERKASFLVDEVEEKNSSEEDVSSKSKNNSRNNSYRAEENNAKKSRFSEFKSPKNNNRAIKCNSKKISVNKSSTPTSRQNVCSMKLNNFKDISNNYLKEINPNCSIDVSNQKFVTHTNINNDVNPLILIHQKYSNIERLRANGVEILNEKDNTNTGDYKNKNGFRKETFNCNVDNTSLNDKKSITAEIDSDNYIEIENDDDNFENEININTNIINNNIRNGRINNNNSFLLNININNINNKATLNSSVNDNISQDLSKSKKKTSSNKPSNKSLDSHKGINDNLFVIPEFNEKIRKKSKTKMQKNDNQISDTSCSCKDILLVDDDEFILKTSKNILKHFKLEADFAENGQECLNMIKKKQEKNCGCSKSKYKLILMDITMPIMDGIEAAKNIQKLIDENKLYDTVKIIFISAHVNLDLKTILSGIKCAVDYYAKPISGDKYKSILDKYYYSK